MSPEMISAEEFDRRFDDGEEILQYFDLENAQRPSLRTQTQKMSIEFPKWMINALEEEAQRLGVSRQAIIKFWLAERLDLTKNEISHSHRTQRWQGLAMQDPISQRFQGTNLY